MMDDSMRTKARATFGKEFMDVMKPQAPAKNEAVALQKRANARPIPTYKVGGAVKGPQPTAAERAAAKAQNESLKKAKVTKKEGEVINSANRSEGGMKKGGKVHTSADTARALATEMGGMKKGGKPVYRAAGGAGKMRKGMCDKPVKRAQGGAAKVRKGMMTPSGQITPGKSCK